MKELEALIQKKKEIIVTQEEEIKEAEGTEVVVDTKEVKEDIEVAEVQEEVEAIAIIIKEMNKKEITFTPLKIL